MMKGSVKDKFESKRSSERNVPLNQRSIQEHPILNSMRNSVDPNYQCGGKGTKKQYSNRTNPYTNLLHSNYIGSTAPSAKID